MAINNGINPEDILGAFAGLPYTLSNMQAQMDPVKAVLSSMGQEPFDGTANRTDGGFPTFEEFQRDLRKQEPPSLPQGGVYNTLIDRGLSPEKAAEVSRISSDIAWNSAKKEEQKENLKSPEVKSKSVMADFLNNNLEIIEMDFDRWKQSPVNTEANSMLESNLSREGISIELFRRELEDAKKTYNQKLLEEERTPEETLLPPTPTPTPTVTPAPPTELPEFFPQGSVQDQGLFQGRRLKESMGYEEAKSIFEEDIPPTPTPTPTVTPAETGEEPSTYWDINVSILGAPDQVQKKQELKELLYNREIYSPKEQYKLMAGKTLGYLARDPIVQSALDRRFDYTYGNWFLENVNKELISVDGIMSGMEEFPDFVARSFSTPKNQAELDSNWKKLVQHSQSDEYYLEKMSALGGVSILSENRYSPAQSELMAAKAKAGMTGRGTYGRMRERVFDGLVKQYRTEMAFTKQEEDFIPQTGFAAWLSEEVGGPWAISENGGM